uniref:Uncharacterized protein LOC111100152 isoform X2 n=1 Tax=Crassostrea virginica TaxID=6565 RepID=A0A8B8A8L2_CRAVI|nr:uncharacterized protein LOC111100152 isoform X2 [Crassostrea virginica]
MRYYVAISLLFVTEQLDLCQAYLPPQKPARQYSRRDICLTAQETLNIVDSCPNDNKTHQERSLKKMCHILPRCKEETLVYHCVKYKERWIEVCAPEGIIIDQTCIQPFNKTKGAIRPTTIGVTDVSSPNKYWPSTQHTGISDDLSKRKTRTKKQSRRKIQPVSQKEEKDPFPAFLIVIFVALVAVIALGVWVTKQFDKLPSPMNETLNEDMCQEPQWPGRRREYYFDSTRGGSSRTTGKVSKRTRSKK